MDFLQFKNRLHQRAASKLWLEVARVGIIGVLFDTESKKEIVTENRERKREIEIAKMDIKRSITVSRVDKIYGWLVISWPIYDRWRALCLTGDSYQKARLIQCHKHAQTFLVQFHALFLFIQC